MTHLEPCPFCAEGSVVLHPEALAPGGPALPIDGSDVQYAHCDGCGAEGPQSYFRAEAVEGWNRRAVRSKPESKRCRPCGSPRSGDVCHKCGGDLVAAHPDWEEPELPNINLIRRLAREVGYAVGVHGSLERDFDLIATPWTDDAVSAEELAAHIVAGMGGTVLISSQKPLGRWACNIQIDGWYKMIDMSVAPRLSDQITTERKLLRDLHRAADSVLTGISVHNTLDADAPARRDDIKGPVISVLTDAVWRTRQALEAPEPEAATDEALVIALAEARDAVDFFDKVRAATPDEKIAVGHDHWDRMEAALRACAALQGPNQ